VGVTIAWSADILVRLSAKREKRSLFRLRD
jgi:hypothetical protein